MLTSDLLGQRHLFYYHEQVRSKRTGQRYQHLTSHWSPWQKAPWPQPPPKVLGG